MRTATVVLTDGTVHTGMRLYGVDNGGAKGLNFHFVSTTDAHADLYRNENDIESITWVDNEQ